LLNRIYAGTTELHDAFGAQTLKISMRPTTMNQTKTANQFTTIKRSGLTIAVSAVLIAGCGAMPTAVQAPQSGGQSGGGGMSMPGGGGSSGGGQQGGGQQSGGSSGGGSSGGGQQGGGQQGGGSQGGGSQGGSEGGEQGGAQGGAQGGGDAGGGGAGGANGEECGDGGISGGGFGGGAGGECDQAGGVGEFPGDADRAEQLGEELDQSVGDFDEAIGEEQRQVSSVGRDTEGYGEGSGGGGGSIGLGEQEAGASGGSGGAGAGSGGAAGTGQEQAGPLDGMSDEEIQARTPEDVDVSAYDDIVARQLREAAIAENDPELRERLWEEYRKYKGLK
jgi:hypothetical protein